MSAIASQITSLTVVYSTVYSDADQREHESSASLAFVRGIHRGPVNSLHKWPVTRKMFPFDDVIMFFCYRQKPRRPTRREHMASHSIGLYIPPWIIWGIRLVSVTRGTEIIPSKLQLHSPWMYTLPHLSKKKKHIPTFRSATVLETCHSNVLYAGRVSPWRPCLINTPIPIAELNPLTVKYVQRVSPETVNWTNIFGSIPERNLMNVQNVVNVSPNPANLSHTFWYTVEQNRSVVQCVVSVSTQAAHVTGICVSIPEITWRNHLNVQHVARHSPHSANATPIFEFIPGINPMSVQNVVNVSD